jgi:hypothetical protein
MGFLHHKKSDVKTGLSPTAIAFALGSAGVLWLALDAMRRLL